MLVQDYVTKAIADATGPLQAELADTRTKLREAVEDLVSVRDQLNTANGIIDHLNQVNQSQEAGR